MFLLARVNTGWVALLLLSVMVRWETAVQTWIILTFSQLASTPHRPSSKVKKEKVTYFRNLSVIFDVFLNDIVNLIKFVYGW